MSFGGTTYATVFFLTKLGLINELKDFDPLEEAECFDPRESLMSYRKHQRLMGRAATILASVIHHGGTKEEVVRAAKYAMIVNDAYKYSLNTDEACERFGIKELETKYKVYSSY